MSHFPKATSLLRTVVAALLVAATMTVATTSSARVAKADSGEAPFGTPTQSLQSAISLASSQTCVIANGNLLCWGGNKNGVIGNGQSGNGNTLNQIAPSYVRDSAANSGERLSNVVGVATAANHTCAIIAPLGKVKCWGYIGGNLLGRHADFQNAWQPFPEFVKNAFVNSTELASSSDLVDVTSIAIGTYGSCALINDGKVKCWGQSPGHEGSGVGYVTTCTTQPTDNTGCTNTTGVPISNVKQISKSGDTACAIYLNGSMQCWGSDTGLYGNGVAGQSSLYPKNTNPDTHGALALGSGEFSQCGLYQNIGTVVSAVGGTVKCWGANNSGDLGRNSVDASPAGVEAVNGITNAIAIAGHERTYCALLVDTTVKCWGGNMTSQTSSSTGAGALIVPYVMLSNRDLGTVLTGVAAVSVGQNHVCVIMQSNGAVRCSGQNNEGQLGDGTVIGKAVGTVVTAGESCTTNCVGRTLSGSGGEFMPPAFLSAEVGTTGQKIVLSYEKDLSSTNLPSPSSYLLTVGGVTRGVSSVSVVGKTVELTLSNPVSRTLAVSITYTDPTTDNDVVAIQDTVGNDAATITAVSATNNSTVDLVAPLLVSGAVSTTGTTLTLTYDEPLNSTTALPERFTLTVAGRTKTVSSVAVAGSTVILTVASPVIQSPQAVSIAYSAIDADNAVTTNRAVQDTAGNDAASFSTSAIVVSNGSTVANLAPSLISSETNATGTKVILTYDEPLGTTLPTVDKFTINIGTSPAVRRTVESVVRGTDTTTVELTLTGLPINAGETVTVAYLAPSSNDATSNAAIQDIAGKDALGISTSPVTTRVDNDAPTFVSGAVNSIGSLVLTYSETLGSNGPSSSRVTVQINGVSVTVSSVTIVNATVVVVTSPVIGVGDTVTFSYEKPTAGNDAFAIQDAAGNDVASSSSAYSVPSGSNNSVVDTAKPTLTSGAVTTDGKLVLTYNETLGTPGPLASQVTVTVNGETVVVTGVVVSGSTVVITTNPPIEIGDVVTFSYTDPTAGNDAAAIQDAAGNDVATSGSAYSVPGGNNASTIDTRQPAFVGGAVSGGGTLVLTYSEPLDGDGPSTSSIVVTINGVEVTVTDVVVIGSTIVVTTSPLIGPDDVVTYKYVDPSTGNDSEAIQDSAGNDIATSNNPYALPSSGNSSTIDKVKPAAPTDVSINTGGDKITMVFPEDMSGTKPAGSDFTVTVDGVVYTVTGVEINGKDVVLVVSPSIKTGQTVMIAYKDPSAGNDANALQDAAGNDVSSFSGTKVNNKSTQPSAVNQVDSILDSTLPLDRTSVDAVKVVDGDAASASTSMSETMTVSGKSGTAKFSDGSSFAVSKNGNLIPKLFTAYIGTVTGSVKVTYKVGKKTTSVTCSYGKYGSTKPKKVTKSQNGWYPKAFISPTKSCKMPAAAVKALNTQMVTIAANLKFVRLWPTTGKPKNPESGAAVRPVKRSYSVKIGTEPK